MNFDRILIITYARSGSTLLQGVLNSIPGACIRGENAGTLTSLFEAFSSVELAQKEFGHWAHSPENPWFGADKIDPAGYGRDLVGAFERNVLCPPEGTDVIGFKEIRYAFMEEDQFGRLISFVRRFFRRPAFIVNTRNLEATIASAERARIGLTADQFRRADEMLQTLATSGASDVFHVRYDDYAHDASSLRALFDFLGAPFDEQVIKQVLDRAHSTFTEPTAQAEGAEGGSLPSDPAAESPIA